MTRIWNLDACSDDDDGADIQVFIPGPPGPSGGGSIPATPVSANYTVLSTDRFLVVTGNCTLTMPDAVINVGMYLSVKLFGGTLVEFLTVNSQLFDGNEVAPGVLIVNEGLTAFNLYASQGGWLIC